MKNFFKTGIVLIVIAMTASYRIAQSQSTYTIKDSKDIDMKLSGTSTMHKWTMDAQTFTGDAAFGFNDANNHQLDSLTALTFSLKVKDLKSDEKLLDKNAYKALKTDEYKDIFYKLTSAKVFPVKGNKHLVKTIGNLTIAGITNEVTMDVYCVLNKDATITCTGSEKLKMSDYEVEPPSFMLGAMKTGDDITLDFTLVYKK